MKNNEKSEKIACRLNKVGGQAVLEGVMMKAGEHTVTTCRKDDGSLVVTDAKFVSVRKKHKILNIPILRGVINFVEMLMLSFKTLGASAEALGLDEEEDGKFTRWMKKHLGLSLTDAIMIVAMILGVALALGLFLFLPTAIADLIDYLLSGRLGVFRAAVEGVAKVLIFLTYLWLVALMPDIKRTFMYHGAEHKSIACFEAGGPLTPENAKNYTRFHPRCGTSFMFFMILLGIIAGFFIRYIAPDLPTIAYTGIRILILPLLMGVGYEIIMLAGKHDNAFTRALSAPGIWVQRITTREPDESMLEVAIVSIKCALRDEFPEFREFYESRAWEAKADTESTGEENAEDTQIKVDNSTDSQAAGAEKASDDTEKSASEAAEINITENTDI